MALRSWEESHNSRSVWPRAAVHIIVDQESQPRHKQVEIISPARVCPVLLLSPTSQFPLPPTMPSSCESINRLIHWLSPSLPEASTSQRPDLPAGTQPPTQEPVGDTVQSKHKSFQLGWRRQPTDANMDTMTIRIALLGGGHHSTNTRKSETGRSQAYGQSAYIVGELVSKSKSKTKKTRELPWKEFRAAFIKCFQAHLQHTW